jgi:uncharacterized protein
MLIEFSVTNFKSIQTTQTLSMVASPATELQEQNSFTTSENGVPRLLRSVAIYGPNASGKSNLLEAIDFMESFVTESSKEGQEGEPIEVKPFLFNTVSRTDPSEFEVLFLQEGVRYQYGFAVNYTRVTHEWLIAYPEGRPQRWFERKCDTAANKESWYFGSKFKGHKTVLQETTRSNALFLSTAVQLNNEQLKPVFNWFHQKLRTIGVSGLAPTYSASLCKTDAGRKRVLELLNAADLSISDLKVEMKKFDSADLPSDTPEPLKDMISKQLDGKEMPEVKFLHTVAGSEELVALDPDDESVGTRKLFTLAGPWLDVLDNGHVLFVDELNNSMHPLMVRFLISLINNPQINRKNAQLIFSTHDTSVLDNELFRRDQIWFTEKDAANATKLYPLSDFTPRKGEALEKGYLNGRYGALPYIGDVRF